MNFRNSLPLLILALVSLTGCTYFENGVPQDVEVTSFPSGANVMKDGTKVGVTPTIVPMQRKLTHNILLTQEGYYDHQQSIFPIRNEAGHALIQFGLLEDFGYYFDLVPNPVEVQMLPKIIPLSRGPDPYSEMLDKVSTIDQRRERGELGPVEHRYIIEKIIDFYSE
ncbi:MAG: PEGA domain-containing protein [Opitutales bacterium]